MWIRLSMYLARSRIASFFLSPRSCCRRWDDEEGLDEGLLLLSRRRSSRRYPELLL